MLPFSPHDLWQAACCNLVLSVTALEGYYKEIQTEILVTPFSNAAIFFSALQDLGFAIFSGDSLAFGNKPLLAIPACVTAWT